MEIIPAVDVLDGSVVRLRQGDYGDATVFGNDPAAAVRRFGRSGAGIVHVVDLGAARSGRGDPALWERIAGAGVPFQAAGGVRTVSAAEAAVAAGAARVVVGSAAVWSPAVLSEIVAAVGPQRVVVSVDVRGGRARGSGWEDEGAPVAEVTAAAVGAGAGRIMVTSIERDGMLQGPDVRMVSRMVAAVPVPVIASGGVSSETDVRSLAGTGAEAAVIGRAFYDGGLTFAGAVAAARQREAGDQAR